MLKVDVSTISFGSQDVQPLPKVTLHLVSERVSAREIIERTVKKQIALLSEQLNQKNHEIRNRLNRQYLADADLKSMAGSGKISMPTGKEVRELKLISVEAEQRRAIAAYELGRFKIFVNDTELISPEDTITLTDNAKIRFIRLIPLAGG